MRLKKIATNLLILLATFFILAAIGEIAFRKELFFPFDGHFNPEANKVVAKAIVEDRAFREALKYDIITERREK